MRRTILCISLLVIFAGCERAPSVSYQRVRGLDVEIRRYPDRSFVLIDGGVIIDPAGLAGLGFREATDADRSSYRTGDRYPGHYGIGLDTRDEAKIYVRRDDWVTYVDGGQKAEFADPAGAAVFVAAVR